MPCPPTEEGVAFLCFSASWLLFLLDLYSWFSWHDRKCKVTEVNCHQGAGSELGLQGKPSSPGVLYTEMEAGLAPPCSAQLTPGSLPTQPPPLLTAPPSWVRCFGGGAGPTLSLLGSWLRASPKVSSEMDSDAFFLNKSIVG